MVSWRGMGVLVLVAFLLGGLTVRGNSKRVEASPTKSFANIRITGNDVDMTYMADGTFKGSANGQFDQGTWRIEDDKIVMTSRTGLVRRMDFEFQPDSNGKETVHFTWFEPTLIVEVYMVERF